MDRETYLNEKPFAFEQKHKEFLFRTEMKKLTEHHRKECKPYDDICNGLEKSGICNLDDSGPYLPVTIFKNLDLYSVQKDKIVKRVTSSGTTGQQVSKIYLDASTSVAQQKALCMIAGDFIGTSRIPMLIIDSPDVLRDRKKFSARGAGILGFSMMARERYYALTPEMQLDWKAIEEFCEKTKEGPTFAFGFTYIIWEYFYKILKEAYSSKKNGKILPNGKRIELRNCHLIHGGGWKKLQNESVSDKAFKAGICEVTGIEKISDYYGMAEQTGSIFMQCSEGHLHSSIYSEIKVLNYEDFSECEVGEWGLLALESLLPESYPGHKLLTEDWGRIIGEDDCPCGRKGKYFEIKGRIQKAEIRGCSDTFENNQNNVDSAGKNKRINENVATADNAITVPGGTYPVKETAIKPFDKLVVDYLGELSKLFTKDVGYRQYPEIYALGFWCRRAHIDKLKSRQERTGLADLGKGLVLHITPSNMPTMFAYSWIASLLAGNSNIVRLSQRNSEISGFILDGINEILNKPKYYRLKEMNAFVNFSREHPILRELSMRASARIIWGGDDTVKAITKTPKSEKCIDITFPDKYSIALLDAECIAVSDEHELKRQVHMFYNDTYGADQNACSSPKAIFWLKGGMSDGDYANAKARWWEALVSETKNYNLHPWMATEKYRILCAAYAEHCELKPAKTWGNKIYVVPVNKDNMRKKDIGKDSKKHLWKLEARMGIFYEFDINSIEELISYLDEKIQTVVVNSDNCEDILKQIRMLGCDSVDRVVNLGEALDFDTIWDRKDLIDMLSV